MPLGLSNCWTSCLLRAVDASRPLLCFLTVILSMTFAVLLYVHTPRFKTPSDPSEKEPQPMYVLPTMIILVHICAAVVGIEAYCRIVVDQRSLHLLPRCIDRVAYVSVFFAPVVGWLVLKLLPGPTMSDLMLGVPGAVRAGLNGTTVEKGIGGEAEVENLRIHEEQKNPAHIVLSSAWSRVAIAAAAMEASSPAVVRLFTHHATVLGNGVVVLCTIALAAPNSSTDMPVYVRAIGLATVVAAVLYQTSVFVPGAFARPPAMALMFILCFTHDVAMIIGALSCVGTCEGSGCVSLAGNGYAYDVSATSLAALSSIMLTFPFVFVAFAGGLFVYAIPKPNSEGCSAFLGMLALFFLLGVPVGSIMTTFVALFHAAAMSIPCLSLIAVVVLGLCPRCPAAAAKQTILHVFCDGVNAEFMRAVALVGSGSAAESVPLSPLCCNSSVLCRGPTAPEIHVLRHRAAAHLEKLRLSPITTDCYQPRRFVIRAHEVAVLMAETAAVLTPFPTSATLPAHVTGSRLADLTEYLVAAETAASAERRAPVAVFMDGAGMGPRCAADAAPTIAPAAPPPAFHIDLATETFDHALEGGWRWLLRFAWRRWHYAPLPGHPTPAVIVDACMWRDRGSYAHAKVIAVWATLAALLLSRPVLFFATLLEPAVNTNVPTTAYVCIAVRVACWAGLALIAPALYRTVCRAAAFSVVRGPSEARHSVPRAVAAAARCIAAAYDTHLPTVLRGAVPHRVVSHVVIGDVVALYLRPKLAKGGRVV